VFYSGIGVGRGAGDGEGNGGQESADVVHVLFLVSKGMSNG
jgi:hypothetical protein